ncbi:MAG TPA: DUF1573 domain-containing protein [Chitinophagaceae bacterium]|nr:DUF1573 domain-containing protein [Chitinophagaceae bacterium]
MNANLKTILLTVLTLSILTIAIIELMGVSSTAFINPKSQDHVHVSYLDEVSQENNENELALTTVEFTTSHHDFGQIKEGEIAKHQFTFTNTGKHPLQIERVIPSCGCTVPHYPKEPIKPNEQGVIEFEFNSQNRVGQNHRDIRVVANTAEEHIILTFKAEVLPAE